MGLNKILNSSQFQLAKPESINTVNDDFVGKTILLHIIQVGNAMQLILVPDLDSYYAMDTVITKLLELGQLIG